MSAPNTTDDSRWQAIRRRDPSAHSSFVYAVTSTRIYCRPTCPARLARRANVIFYNSAAAADKDKFRPCMRCSPDQDSQTLERRHQSAITQACDIIRQNPRVCKPQDIARQMGFSPRYFHGLFKPQTGMTPSQFAERCLELSDSMSRTASTQAGSSETPIDLLISTQNRDTQALPSSTKASTLSTASTQRAPYETLAVIQDLGPDLGMQASSASTWPRTMMQDIPLVLPDVSLHPEFACLSHCEFTSQSLSAWFDFNQYYTSLPMDNTESIE